MSAGCSEWARSSGEVHRRPGEGSFLVLLATPESRGWAPIDNAAAPIIRRHVKDWEQAIFCPGFGQGELARASASGYRNIESARRSSWSSTTDVHYKHARAERSTIYILVIYYTREKERDSVCFVLSAVYREAFRLALALALKTVFVIAIASAFPDRFVVSNACMS
ncbi:hypothetical protein QAD02_010361 [Eretmocerus hayati]|uniref:Uncharacterized protein n=1 Tax=Eretmocerus hayati TaxID=131215 RepID=A0ACC2NCK7_9HYME|nr:hypothetical protein QAD02_010361 [Eretmocerus hayati]